MDITSQSADLSGADPTGLSSCDREPIHQPESIQAHGALFVVTSDTGVVTRAAVGSRRLRVAAASTIGRSLKDLFADDAALFDRLAESGPDGMRYLGMLTRGEAHFQVVAHRSGGAWVVEFEEAEAGDAATFDTFHPHLRGFLDRLPLAAEIADLAALAAEEVRRITGLDRALIYRFDTDWHGEVIAEDRNEMLPSYLGLRFPASDIPQPARELYRRNRLRLIADTDCTPAALVPALRGDEAPLDLSLSVLRGVSPTHLEYMRNMRTRASMSIALLRGGELWGLIACHHAAPSRVPYHVRNACDFIGQVLSLQIAAKEDAALAEHRAALQQVQTRLLAHMAAADQFLDGLLAHPDDLLALTGAAGAAVVFDDQCRLVGATPAKAEVMALADWLKTKARRDVFVTEALAAVMPGGEAFKDQASGVLAIAISQIHGSFLIWFRPEIVSTVAWGGEPRKVNAGPDKRIQPRASFATWRETVRLRARPWSPAEISAAADLRTAIVDIVLRKAEELAALSERLTTTNRELEAFSYSVSHDLRAPFRHIVGYAQLLKKLEAEHLSDKGNRYIDTIVDSAIAAGTLVDNLLSFSQMGRAALRIVSVDVGELVADVRRRLAADCAGRTVEWRIAPLPNAKADPTMLRLVFQNLLENAVKFTRGREVAVIEVGFGEVAADDGTTVGAYFVRDNGTGFDMAYVGKLFGVFQRLHRVEEFEGTGIGLANVHRIVERHDGRVWADAKVDQGATFFFTLPPKD